MSDPCSNNQTQDKGGNTYVFRDGHGSDGIDQFSTDHDKIVFDMIEIANFIEVKSRMSEVAGDTVITLSKSHTLTLHGVKKADLTPENFHYSAGPVCILAGTPIRTERGDIPIEELRPDDVIWTKDRGWQELKLVVREPVIFRYRDDPAKPVLIPKGALGGNRPTSDLVASPQQRVLLTKSNGEEEELVPAVSLAGSNGIRQMRGKKRATYMNVVLERHSIIQAAGCWVESLLVTQRTLSRQSLAARQLLAHALDVEPAKRVEPQGTRPRRLKSA